MRVAVTGGSGNVGRFVVKELVARGHDVINIDRREPAEKVARFVQADLTQRAQVQPIFEQVEAVCHLGEIPNVRGRPSPEEVFATNTRIGSIVLQTAADLQLKRVIYTSSCQVYGMWDGVVTSPMKLPFDETQPVHPHNGYALSKVCNEGYGRMVAEKHGLSVAAFRFPYVVSRDYSDDMAASMKDFPPRTDGFATYLHATDAARAYALALDNRRAGFEAYHFAAEEILSLYPLAERLRRHHPSFPPLPANWPAFKSPLLMDKARRDFGWAPHWNFLQMYRARHGEIAAR
jgi:nucleoside-diphosphate-sugar epimerase